jgi:hypothetical protein
VLAVLALAAPASAAGGQVIVKFALGAATRSAIPSNASMTAQTIHGLGAHVVKTTGDPAALAAALNARPGVEYAEVDQQMNAFATPNDPGFPQLYGLDNTGQTGGTPDADIDAPAAGTLPAWARSGRRAA